MGFFTDGDDEDDELFDMYMLNELSTDSNKHGNSNSSGGCLTCLLFMITIPVIVIKCCISLLV